MLIEMELREIVINDNSPHHYVILEEKGGSRGFPIFIGIYEAAMLDSSILGKESARPLTHDLLVNTIREIGAELVAVHVDELKHDTFYGKLVIKTPTGETVKVDSRPSDAMVIAAKEKVPIFVSDEILAITDSENQEE